MIKKVRESNMELFRMLAMFMVLIVHANFLALGEPTKKLFDENPTLFFGQYFFESLSIGCVNMFVLLSGWFGIRPSKKGFLNLLFQGLFFSFGICFFIICFVETDFSLINLLKKLGDCFWLFGKNWFILSYIGLYILSPMLNIFIENINKRNLEYFLFAFFVFQTLYGWVFTGARFFESGYSTFSFIGLYVLARYCNFYTPTFAGFSRNIDFLIFISLVVIIAFVSSISLIIFNVAFISGKMFVYTNPLLIIASLYLLLYFSKLNIGYKSLINKIAASTFAVYLLHIDPNIFIPYFKPMIKNLAIHFDGFAFLLLVFFALVLVYIVSIILDQIRIFVWNNLLSYIIKRNKI